jgi:phage gp36-like protein
MAYATEEDIVNRYGSEILTILADFDDDSEVDSDKVELALTDASSAVDGYLGGRYQTPLEDTTPILTKITVDIAVYNLGVSGIGGSEQRKEHYDNALAYLKDISRGHIGLGIAQEDAQPAGGEAEFYSEDRLFSRDNLSGF